jgi:hypothetical protein
MKIHTEAEAPNTIAKIIKAVFIVRFGSSFDFEFP